MKKEAKELQKGNKIIIAGKKAEVTSVELSDIGKQGKRKARIEANTEDGEKIVVVRPEDYPIDSE